MIDELEIQGFRCFHALTANPLGRVNLLVGKNNAGKSAFLDAVELLVSDGTPPVFRSLVRRSEYSRKTYEEVSGKLFTQFELYPANLFHGRQLLPDTEYFVRSRHQGVFVRYVEKSHEISGGLAGIKTRIREKTQLVVRCLPADTNTAWDLGLDGSYSVRANSLEPRRAESKTPAYFLPTARADIQLLSRLWDDVQLTDEEALIPQVLQFIEPQVEKVGRRGDGENLHFVVRFKGDKEPRRLGSLGDGMRHLLAIALHLVPARNGYLFIDEIDTGLHHSVMAQMWRMLIESARRLNVQIFATTHSMDCIYALAAVHQQMNLTKEDLMLHRLVAGMDKTIPYTPDDLAAVAEFQGEVR